ncbi:MAG: hydroxymethylglutaryl-CoA lyase [Chitinophagaceae bacterium]|nr:hydroxymethylglutaryl-CoA lyase [Chitinophagaceae bacterium]
MQSSQSIKLIECPRDAMQGWPVPIPSETKINYLNALLQVGFHTLDFGSFVSPKAVPQMADTAEVLKHLQLNQTNTRLLAIVANLRGAETAAAFDEISYLGFPFSVSETFQLKNTNATIAEAIIRVDEIQNICLAKGKELVIYISMGFGNPYGDPYNEEIVFEWVNKLVEKDIRIISLADTVGLAIPSQVYETTRYLVESLPGTEIGVHLHAAPQNMMEKLDAAIKAGCRRIDGALKGVGGCPMAGDELIGNLNTEIIIQYLEKNGLLPEINFSALQHCITLAEEIFSKKV